MELKELEGSEIATILTPTTITLVTAKDEEGDCVATCAWVNPLSHQPSIIGVSLRPGGRTAKAIVEGGSFCVNVLDSDSAKIAVLCGKKGEGQPDRFDTANLTKSPCQKVDVVRVDEAMSWIECKLVDRKVYGDHELFVGETLLAQTAGGKALLMEGRSAFGSFAANK